MIFEKIKTNTVFEVKCRVLSQNAIQKGVGFLKYERGYKLFLNNTLYKIEILDQSKLKDIDTFLKTKNLTALGFIQETAGPETFMMEIIFFTYPIQYIHDKFYVNVDENIYKEAKKINYIRNNTDFAKFKERLKRDTVFEINSKKYLLISRGNSSINEIKEERIATIQKSLKNFERKYSEAEDTEEKKKYKKYIANLQNQLRREYDIDLAFTLYTKDFMLPVKKKEEDDDKISFQATRVVPIRHTQKKDTLMLLNIEDIVFSGKPLSEIVKSNLGDIMESENSFLKKWDEFAKLEGERLLKRVLNLGEIKIKTWNKTEEGFELKTDAEIEEGDYLCAVDKTPTFIKEDLNWEEYQRYLNEADPLTRREDIGIVFEVVKKDDDIVTVKTDKNIDFDQKKVFLSIYSDSIQIERRLEAREKIKNGTSANPILGLLIEDSDKLFEIHRPKLKHKIEPLSENVRNKCFLHDPTEKQKEAVSIALNTPDIAIIQGPPGTGKTTVITAILERLSELSDKSKDFAGEILISGIQHDAVENLRSRIKINDLPTPKFGKKSDSDEFYDIENMREFAQKIADKAQKQIPEYEKIDEIKKLEEKFLIYLKSPSKKFAIEILQSALEMNIGFELKKRIKDKIKQLQTPVQNGDLTEIYAIRTTKEGFLDDGVKRNMEVLKKIESSLSEDDKKLLLSTPENLDEYLVLLRKLKSKLLETFTPKPHYSVEKKDTEIVELINEIKKELKSSKKDQIADILHDYVTELKNNPFIMKEIVEDYSMVYAATTQQSMGREIKAKKKELVYDTVIVDEAARVSPMDLLIVMSQAKKRIILVGDDRQLPHLVDETIIKDTELEEDRFIKESMFAYLKQRAKKLTEHDGINRFVTLDEQYRTHPLLGDFVSQNFYEKYGEGFASNRKPEEFTHSIKEIKNTPAVWIDVKNSECREKRAWSRECEAKKIIHYLQKWAKEDKKADFGIITFYRKQVEIIEEMLKRVENYEEIKERVKVGTVDSFQGMEFDIVFLSVVRSKDLKTVTKEMPNYKLFGFLISKNRLCVNMSRQKKALVVVGDLDYYQSEYAKEHVEELYNFAKLCKEKGKIL